MNLMISEGERYGTPNVIDGFYNSEYQLLTVGCFTFPWAVEPFFFLENCLA